MQPVPSSPFLQKQLIMDVKALTRVLFLYIPLPMFWALLDQQVRIVLLKATPSSSPFPPTRKRFLIITSVCPRAHDGPCKPPGWMGIWWEKDFPEKSILFFIIHKFPFLRKMISLGFLPENRLKIRRELSLTWRYWVRKILKSYSRNKKQNIIGECLGSSVG